MTNKYHRHSKAKLTRNLTRNLKAVMATKPPRDPFDDEFDQQHKKTLEQHAAGIQSVFRVATQMYELLNGSGLVEQQRAAAIAILNTLHNRLG